jgi:hypothetical protein
MALRWCSGGSNGWTAAVMHRVLGVGDLLTARNQEIARAYSGFPLKLPVAGRAEQSRITNSCRYGYLTCDDRIMSP